MILNRAFLLPYFLAFGMISTSLSIQAFTGMPDRIIFKGLGVGLLIAALLILLLFNKATMSKRVLELVAPFLLFYFIVAFSDLFNNGIVVSVHCLGLL